MARLLPRTRWNVAGHSILEGLELSNCPQRTPVSNGSHVQFGLRGTHVRKVDVRLRTARAALRHSRPELTADVYTDPKLLDEAAALDALPSLPLDTDDRSLEAERLAATGTGDVKGDALASTRAPNPGKGCTSGTSSDKNTNPATVETCIDAECASDCGRKRKPPLTSPANSGLTKRVKGLEPSTFSLEGWRRVLTSRVRQMR